MLMMILVAVAMVIVMAVVVVTSGAGVERKRVEKRFPGSVARNSAPERLVVLVGGRLLPPRRQPLPEGCVGQQQRAGHDQQF